MPESAAAARDGDRGCGRLAWLPIHRLRLLQRNPQYLSTHELAALEASIRRDGFLAPILCRKHPLGGYELLSGNHRVIAARAAGLRRVPALIVSLNDAQAARAAVNLNTVHGEPPAELLAPFLARLDDATWPTVHLPEALRRQVLDLDRTLATAFAGLQPPAHWNRPSPRARLPRPIPAQ
ncbi:MAG: ParB/RepB/Spo0J family partition protein [Terriglobales bacterium]